jgi:hypothetical protein
MKNCLLRTGWAVSLLLIGCGGLARAAEPLVASSGRPEFAVDQVLLPVGTPRSTFLEQVGEPDAWLSPDVAVYWDRQTNQPRLTRGCDTLLVEFDQGRVGRLRIVVGTVVREFLAKRGKSSPSTMIAAITPPPRSGK